MSRFTNGIVIVGGGQAGLQVAASLRASGYEERLRLLAEEPHLPYQRPPLSKAYLLGKASAESLPLRPGAFFEQQRIEVELGVRVQAIDVGGRRLRAGAAEIPFDGLALATGGRVRRLTVPGAGHECVLYLRTREDADALKERLAAAHEVVVIGGGFIGLEVAASANMLGKQVAVVEALPRLMARVVPPVLSQVFEALHKAHGVRIVTGCTVTAIESAGGGRVTVRTAQGDALGADLVVVGIGIAPCEELAAQAGLACANGIVVDEHSRTQAPAIVAAGDCANHPNAFAEGARVRLESVQNAIDQAKTAAGALLGEHTPYRAVPWFWSDQYDVKLQMVGLSQGHDRVVLRGEPASRRFSAFYYRGARLVAIDSVNRPADHMLGRRLLAAGIGPTPEEAADEGFDLKTLLARPRLAESGASPRAER